DSALPKIGAGEAVTDGEVLATDSKGASHFQQLMAAGVKHHYAVFDLLWLDGEDLRQRPLEERRDLLESVLTGAPPIIQIAQRLEGSVAGVMAETTRRGLEGGEAKLPGLPDSNRRSTDWLHVKGTETHEQ